MKLPDRKWLDRTVNLYEFFLAYLFIKGAWDVYHAKPVVEGGLVDNLTNQEALYGYSFLLLAQGVGLILSKVLKCRKIHGWVLMSMYLLAFYIVSLSLVVSGWKGSLVLSIFYTLSIGVVYLYWRYRVINKKLQDKISAE